MLVCNPRNSTCICFPVSNQKLFERTANRKLSSATVDFQSSRISRIVSFSGIVCRNA